MVINIVVLMHATHELCRPGIYLNQCSSVGLSGILFEFIGFVNNI